MSLQPVMLHGEAIRALVVGGGGVAARRARSLARSGARVRIVAPRMHPALREAAVVEPALELVERAFRPGDERGATLVVAATDDRDVNRQVAALARAAGIPVNVADRPEEGTLSFAATHRSGDLVVAVAAGGVPAVAARIRDEIAARFDGRYAAAVSLLAGLRERLLGAGDRVEWQRAAAELAGPAFVAQVEDGTLAERVTRWA